MNRKQGICTVLALSTLATMNSAQAEKWNAVNNPGIMDANFNYHLEQLPTEGKLDVIPWSETYWPSKQGSINVRWNQPTPEGFKYTSPRADEVARMTRDELARLSPSEKYDIYMGRYDYPLKEEVKGIATPSARWWSGVCDGWSTAAIQYAEPMAVDAPSVTNPNVVVPFAASDIKGLMSYSAARHFQVESKQVGSKCTGIGKIFGGGACSDINAGALHVILANQIGVKKQGFIVERDPGNQIWNQPVYGFKFTKMGSAQSKDGAYGVRMQGTLFFADELDKPEWLPVVGTKKFVEGKIEMDYILDLDSAGNIIGGDWVGKNDHPDFVWLPVNHLEFKDYMDGINRLYKVNQVTSKE
jgi:hypothetical protein